MMLNGEIKYLLDLCYDYKKLFDKIFENLENEMTAIDSAELDVISNYYKGCMPNKYSNLSLEQVKDVFDFHRVSVIYKKMKSDDPLFKVITILLDKYSKVYVDENKKLGLVKPLTANSILKNKRIIDSKINELESYYEFKKNKR